MNHDLENRFAAIFLCVTHVCDVFTCSMFCFYPYIVATVSFNQTEYRVSEAVGSSAYWVELKNDLQLNAEVRLVYLLI